MHTVLPLVEVGTEGQIREDGHVEENVGEVVSDDAQARNGMREGYHSQVNLHQEQFGPYFLGEGTDVVPLKGLLLEFQG